MENLRFKDAEVSFSIENIHQEFYMNTYAMYEQCKKNSGYVYLTESVLENQQNLNQGYIEFSEEDESYAGADCDKDNQSFFSKFFDNWKVSLSIKNLTIELFQERPTRKSSSFVLFIDSICINKDKNWHKDCKQNQNFASKKCLIGVNRSGIKKYPEKPKPFKNFSKDKSGGAQQQQNFMKKNNNKPNPEKKFDDSQNLFEDFDRWDCQNDPNVIWIFAFNEEVDMISDTNNKRNVVLDFLMFKTHQRRDIKFSIKLEKINTIQHLYDQIVIKRFLDKQNLFNAQKYLLENPIELLDNYQFENELDTELKQGKCKSSSSDHHVNFSYRKDNTTQNDLIASNKSIFMSMTHSLMNPENSQWQATFDHLEEFNQMLISTAPSNDDNKPDQSQNKNKNRLFVSNQTTGPSGTTTNRDKDNIFGLTNNNDNCPNSLLAKTQATHHQKQKFEKSPLVPNQFIQQNILGDGSSNTTTSNNLISEVNFSLNINLKGVYGALLTDTGDYDLAALTNVDGKFFRGLSLSHYQLTIDTISVNVCTIRSQDKPFCQIDISQFGLYLITPSKNNEELYSPKKMSEKSMLKQSFYSVNNGSYSVNNSSVFGCGMTGRSDAFQSVLDLDYFINMNSEPVIEIFSKQIAPNHQILLDPTQSPFTEFGKSSNKKLSSDSEQESCDNQKLQGQQNGCISVTMTNSLTQSQARIKLDIHLGNISANISQTVFDDFDNLDMVLEFVQSINKILTTNCLEMNAFDIIQKEKISFYKDATELELQSLCDDLQKDQLLKKKNKDLGLDEKTQKNESDLKESMGQEDLNELGEPEKRSIKTSLTIDRQEFNIDVCSLEKNDGYCGFRLLVSDKIKQTKIDESLQVYVPGLDLFLINESDEDFLQSEVKDGVSVFMEDFEDQMKLTAFVGTVNIGVNSMLNYDKLKLFLNNWTTFEMKLIKTLGIADNFYKQVQKSEYTTLQAYNVYGKSQTKIEELVMWNYNFEFLEKYGNDEKEFHMLTYLSDFILIISDEMSCYKSHFKKYSFEEKKCSVDDKGWNVMVGGNEKSTGGVFPLNHYNEVSQKVKQQEKDAFSQKGIINFFTVKLGGAILNFSETYEVDLPKKKKEKKWQAVTILDEFYFNTCSLFSSKDLSQSFNNSQNDEHYLCIIRSKRDKVKRLDKNDLKGLLKSIRSHLKSKNENFTYFAYGIFDQHPQTNQTKLYLSIRQLRIQTNLSVCPSYGIVTNNLLLNELLSEIEKYLLLTNKRTTEEVMDNIMSFKLSFYDLRIHILFNDTLGIIFGPEKMVIDYHNIMKNFMNLRRDFRIIVKNFQGSATQKIEYMKDKIKTELQPVAFYLKFLNIESQMFDLKITQKEIDLIINTRVNGKGNDLNHKQQQFSEKNDPPMNNSNTHDNRKDSSDTSSGDKGHINPDEEKTQLVNKNSQNNCDFLSKDSNEKNGAIRLVLTLEFMKSFLLALDYTECVINHYIKFLKIYSNPKNSFTAKNQSDNTIGDQIYGQDFNEFEKSPHPGKKDSGDDDWDVDFGKARTEISQIENILRGKVSLRTEDQVNFYNESFEQISDIVTDCNNSSQKETNDKHRDKNIGGSRQRKSSWDYCFENKLNKANPYILKSLQDLELGKKLRITLGIKEIQLITGDGFLGPDEIQKQANPVNNKSFINVNIGNITVILSNEILYSKILHEIYPSAQCCEIFEQNGYNGAYYWKRKQAILANVKDFNIYDHIIGSSYKYIMHSDKKKKNFLDFVFFHETENWSSLKPNFVCQLDEDPSQRKSSNDSNAKDNIAQKNINTVFIEDLSAKGHFVDTDKKANLLSHSMSQDVVINVLKNVGKYSDRNIKYSDGNTIYDSIIHQTIQEEDDFLIDEDKLFDDDLDAGQVPISLKKKCSTQSVDPNYLQLPSALKPSKYVNQYGNDGISPSKNLITTAKPLTKFKCSLNKYGMPQNHRAKKNVVSFCESVIEESYDKDTLEYGKKSASDKKNITFRRSNNVKIYIKIAPVIISLHNESIDFQDSYQKRFIIILDVKSDIKQCNYSEALTLSNEAKDFDRLDSQNTSNELEVHDDIGSDHDGGINTKKAGKSTLHEIMINQNYLYIHDQKFTIISMTNTLNHKANLVPSKFQINLPLAFIESEIFTSKTNIAKTLKNQYMLSWRDLVYNQLRSNAKNQPMIGVFVSGVEISCDLFELVFQRFQKPSHTKKMSIGKIVINSTKLATLTAVKTAGMSLKVFKECLKAIGMIFFCEKLGVNFLEKNSLENSIESLLMKVCFFYNKIYRLMERIIQEIRSSFNFLQQI